MFRPDECLRNPTTGIGIGKQPKVNGVRAGFDQCGCYNVELRAIPIARDGLFKRSPTRKKPAIDIVGRVHADSRQIQRYPLIVMAG